MTAYTVERNAGFVARFNMAIAEAGYPWDTMHLHEDGNIAGTRFTAPPAVVWQALYLAKDGDLHPCWSCWNVSNAADPLGDDWERSRWASDCVTGRRGGCHFPEGPALPPKESLVGPIRLDMRHGT